MTTTINSEASFVTNLADALMEQAAHAIALREAEIVALQDEQAVLADREKALRARVSASAVAMADVVELESILKRRLTVASAIIRHRIEELSEAINDTAFAVEGDEKAESELTEIVTELEQYEFNVKRVFRNERARARRAIKALTNAAAA